jgi:cellulose synthase/poly-beta-1,6-N-acetylglucosamine synthase-like glycosyltransferase
MTQMRNKSTKGIGQRIFYATKLSFFGFLFLVVSLLAGYCVYIFVPIFSFQIISVFLIIILLSNIFAKLFIDYLNY